MVFDAPYLENEHGNVQSFLSFWQKLFFAFPARQVWKKIFTWEHLGRECPNLNDIVRENQARPKDRGPSFIFIYSQYKSYPKILTTVSFAELGVRFLSIDYHIMILGSQAV